jgi:6-phosphogluconolactonase
MGSTERIVIVHPDAALTAEAIGQRLAALILERQSVRVPVHIALTGGSLGVVPVASLAANPLVAAIAWPDVHVWWGDEAFLPDGHPDRRDTGARAAIAASLPLPPANIHPVPGPGPGIASPEAAAEAYGAELARHAPKGALAPAFDLVMLGIGEDGHIASLFPGSPLLEVADRAALGVPHAPGPPPERITLSVPALRSAAQIWFATAGPAKAQAVSDALDGSGPAALVEGRTRTLWLVDSAAAGGARPRP